MLQQRDVLARNATILYIPGQVCSQVCEYPFGSSSGVVHSCWHRPCCDSGHETCAPPRESWHQVPAASASPLRFRTESHLVHTFVCMFPTLHAFLTKNLVVKTISRRHL